MLRCCCHAILVFLVVSLAITSPAEAQKKGPKVGSPEWKKEFERKRKEMKRKHDAAMRGMSSKFRSSKLRSSSRSRRPSTQSVNGYKITQQRIDNRSKYQSKTTSTRHSKGKKQNKGNPNFRSSKSPSECILEFRAASKRATSYKQLLKYVSSMQRKNYETSVNNGSKWDHLKFKKDLLEKIVRYDAVRIKGDTAYLNVIRFTGGSHPYTEGTFTLKGENGRWTMHEYKDKSHWSKMPAAPE